jgi:hypothetical protein
MEKTCKFCAKIFDSKYSNRLFCSGRCRKAASRRNQRIDTNPDSIFHTGVDAARFNKLQMAAPQAVALLVGMIKRHGEGAARDALEVAFTAAFPQIDRAQALESLNALLTEENGRLYAKIADLTNQGKPGQK